MSDATTDSYVRACTLAELADEAAVAVDVDGEDVAVIKSEGEVFAIRDECSHAAVPLSEGDIEHCQVECYLHGSRFDLRTGAVLNPPATEPVPVYPIRITDDIVYVDVDHPIGA